MNPSRWILWSSITILSVIWCCSFAISYVSLAEVAYANGIAYPWAWMWPLLLDAFMSISSLDVIRREMNHESALPAWVVVVAVTILSTAFNVTRAYPTSLSLCVHALPPVICFASFEVVMGVLRSDLRRVSLGCQVVSHDVVTASAEVVTGDRQVVEGDRDVVIGCQDVVTASAEVVKVATGVVTGCQEVTTEFREPSINECVETKGNARNLIWLLFQENPEASYSEVAKKIGVSRQAVRASVMRMKREG